MEYILDHKWNFRPDWITDKIFSGPYLDTFYAVRVQHSEDCNPNFVEKE